MLRCRRLAPAARRAALLIAIALHPATGAAQTTADSYDRAFEGQGDARHPVVRYEVRVDPADPGGYTVEMVVRQAPETLRVAAPIWAPGAYRVARFARNIRLLSARAGDQPLDVALAATADSSTWRIAGRRDAGADVRIAYRVQHPSLTAARAPNNRSFLRESGALLDGPQTFLYVVGHQAAPAHVRLELPRAWRVATGLVSTADSTVFFAPTYDALIDSPILLGALREWRFAVDGVPHRVAYWPLPDAAPFDTTRFVASVARSVQLARDIMGRLPYRDYTFLFIDGAGGGLEHLNSTTIGAPSAVLARDPLARVGVTAHEFFHLWNVKRVRPLPLGPFDYQRVTRTLDLWWSEGVTDFFAEEIQRRGGFYTEEQARAALADNIQGYLANPAHARISPQRSSWTAWDPPAVNGGFGISYYLQGALLGELLELQLRDATGMARGMDDLMRLLQERHAGARGFTSEELLFAANDVCGCDLQPFFDRHVAGAAPLDFDRYLALLGWRTVVARGPAVDSAGRALPDLRVSATAYGGYGSAGGAAGGRPRLSVGDPTSAWGRAGVRGGDEALRLNGRPVATPDEFRAAVAALRVGDVATLEVLRDGAPVTLRVPVAGYERLRVSIVDLPQPTERQRAMRRRWMTGR